MAFKVSGALPARGLVNGDKVSLTISINTVHEFKELMEAYVTF